MGRHRGFFRLIAVEAAGAIMDDLTSNIVGGSALYDENLDTSFDASVAVADLPFVDSFGVRRCNCIFVFGDR